MRKVFSRGHYHAADPLEGYSAAMRAAIADAKAEGRVSTILALADGRYVPIAETAKGAKRDSLGHSPATIDALVKRRAFKRLDEAAVCLDRLGLDLAFELIRRANVRAALAKGAA